MKCKCFLGQLSSATFASHDRLRYYQHFMVLTQLCKMNLSVVKKAVQRTKDGLTGSLVPDVWEVDHVLSSH